MRAAWREYYCTKAAILQSREAHGVARAFTPAKLIIPTLLSAGTPLEPAAHALEQALGPLDYRSEEIPFTFTDYYHGEMGAGLRRIFFTVARLWDPARLADAKLTTDRIEQRFAGPADPEAADPGPRARTVNLDPGMLTLGRLILASTKDNAQRIPLRHGIYAEITLLYRKGGWQPLPWTYPDYRSESYHAVLSGVRARYKAQLESDSPAP